MNETIVIKTNQVTKYFGSKEAVSNVTLSLERGIIYGLLGKNRAGKTTLFKMLLGLQKPTCGNSYIFGMDIQKNRIAILKK